MVLHKEPSAGAQYATYKGHGTTDRAFIFTDLLPHTHKSTGLAMAGSEVEGKLVSNRVIT